MENGPNLLSLGTMVMKEGSSLKWPAFGRPSLKDPKGKMVEVVMRGTVPTLRAAAADTVMSETLDKENFLVILAGGNPEQVHHALEELFDGFFESQEFKDVAAPVTEPEAEIPVAVRRPPTIARSTHESEAMPWVSLPRRRRQRTVA